MQAQGILYFHLMALLVPTLIIQYLSGSEKGVMFLFFLNRGFKICGGGQTFSSEKRNKNPGGII